MNPIIYHSKDGHVLQYQRSALAGAFLKTDQRVAVCEPIVLPQCAMVPFASWRSILAFFAWSQKEHKAESQISGFLHRDTGVWHFEPFFQRGVGMTTTELDASNEQQAALWASLREMGYDCIAFTAHHHCTSSAFQSGTDHADEYKNKGAGFHVTIGYLDKPVYDLHCRSKFVINGTFDGEGKLLTKGRSEMLPFEITDLVELPIDHAELTKMSAELRKQLCLHYLLARAPEDGSGFPEFWKERIVKAPVTSVHVHQPANGLTWNGYTNHHAKSAFTGTGPYPMEQVLSAISAIGDELMSDNGAKFAKAWTTGDSKVIRDYFGSTTWPLSAVDDARTVLEESWEKLPSGYALPDKFVTEGAKIVSDTLWEYMHMRGQPIPRCGLQDAYTGNKFCTEFENVCELLPEALSMLDPKLIQHLFDEAWGSMRKNYDADVSDIFDLGDKSAVSAQAATWPEEDGDYYDGATGNWRDI